MKNSNGYTESFQKLIQCPTVTGSGKEFFDKFHSVLKEEFPNLHNTCELIPMPGDSLLFKFKGKSDKKPVVFMAHQDVVPAVGGDWKFPPFSATVSDGKIYGRGTMDCKNTLFCSMQAADESIAEGFVPEHDIYLSFSDSEETSGPGAENARDWFVANNVKPAMVVDEGGAIIDSAFPGITKPYAMIGIVEKGYADIKFVAKGVGGHSSQPPKNTPIARLSAFVAYCETHKIFDRQMSEPVSAMLSGMSDGLPGALKFITKHSKAFGPLISKILPKLNPMGGAMFGTTMVFTMSGGSSAPNVIPQEAHIIANLRFAPGDDCAVYVEKLTEIAKKFDVETQVITARNASPVVDVNSAGYKFFEAVIHKTFPEIGVAPYLICGGTDCRTMQEICECAVRCAPCPLTNEQLASMHASNENIDVKSIEDGVKFYKNFIKDYR